MEEKMELKMPSVMKLGKRELKCIEGGINPWWWVAVGVVISEALDRNADNDFWEGYNDFRIDYQNQ